MAAGSNAPRGQSWADVEDSPQDGSQTSHVSDPSQLFPATPESMPAEAPAQLSQSSASAQVFPSTPDPFEASQTGLTQEFHAGMTLCGPGYDAQVQTHEQMGLAGMTSQMPGDFFQPGGVPPTSSSASSSSWNPHTLLNPAKALAAAGSESPDRRGSKNKRGVQQSPKSPAEKRPRPSAHVDEQQAAQHQQQQAAQQQQQHAAQQHAAQQPHVAQQPSDPPDPIDAGAEPVSEETRQNRIFHRTSGVNGIRKSQDYLFLAGLIERGGLIGPPMAYHHPEDESVSKRTWEKGMKEWRHDIRAVAEANGYIHVPPTREDAHAGA